MKFKIVQCFLLSTVFMFLACSKSILPEIREYEKDGVTWYEKKIYCYPKGKYPSTKGAKKLAYVQQFRENILFESIVYYEIWPNWESKFVSKQGFYKYKEGVNQLFNDSTVVPDNIILETLDSNQKSVTYYYKNGKRELYTLGLPDGVKEYVFTRDSSGVFVWKEGEKVFLRELTPEETPKTIEHNE